MRHAVSRILAFSFLFGACVTIGLRADDPKPGEDPLAKRLAAANRKWADEHAALGEFCAGKKLFREAVGEYSTALLRWPAHAAARAYLGYKPQDAGWVEDPAAQVKRANEVTGDTEARLLREYEDRLARLGKRAGADYGQIAQAFVAGARRKEEAEKLWQLALDYDSEHVQAREALGFKKEEGRWVGAEERAERERIAQAVKQASDGQEVADESAVERAVGMKLTKRQSDHFVIQAYCDPVRTKELVRLAETTWAEFHALTEMKKPILGRIEGLVFQTSGQHEKYVEKVSPAPAAQKENMKRLAGDLNWDPLRFEGYESDRGPGYPRDFTVHDTAHLLLLGYSEVPGAKLKAWLYEGMALYFTERITHTAIQFCVASADPKSGSSAQGGGGAAAKRDLTDTKTWRKMLKEQVRADQTYGLPSLVQAGTDAMSQAMAVQSWSLVEFLLTRHRKEFLVFVSGLRVGKEQGAAMRDAMGVGFVELEREWKRYVLANY